MSFLKFKADELFDGYQFKSPGSVLVIDEQGMVENIVDEKDAGDEIRQLRGILSPAFVNCHCHLELSHMRGRIPESTGLVKFVVDVVQQRHFPKEEILKAIEQAEDEMLRNGIIAVGDICNNILTIPQKNKGRLYYHNFVEASGYHPSIAQARFERSLEFFKVYAQHYSIPVESNSIVPHAPYSVSDELWEMILHFPGNHLLTIHNQETAEENEWFLKKEGGFKELYTQMKIDASFYKAHGKTSLQSYLSKFLLNQQLILVHNVHTNQDDLDFAKTQKQIGIFWCVCINANKYITGDLPPMELLMKNDCEVVLGTDSLASNHELSILSEMRTISRSFPSIKIETLLKWATSNGARALQMDGVIGSFEKGKHPGVVLIGDKMKTIQRVV
jgi:aminodeoxyfutalosine deaminase